MAHRRPHHNKRKQPAEEEEVDDLLIASMAVASTWMPAEKASDGSSDGSIASEDGAADDVCKDADEISLDDEPHATTDADAPDVKDMGTSSADAEENTSNVKEDTTLEHSSAELPNNNDLSNPRIHQESDDESEIDLTENLANMLDEDEEPKRKDTKSYNGIYQGPKTEHEIDPYTTCPIDELEKLNVGKEFSGLDDATRSKLRVAGVVRSYLAEQRTIVVDSLIPASLQQNSAMNEPLDEGSVMAILLNGGDEVTTLQDASSLQILGKVVEVFGPVQRPLYVIRLPDAPQAVHMPEKKEDTAASSSKANMEESKVSDEAKTDDTNDSHEESTSNTNGTERANAAEKRKISEVTKELVDDPWSTGGKLSTMLHNTPNAVIYSVIDHSTLINKEQIIKISGKGCDASNMFDEEVGPSEQQDFSDDEDERNAKKGNRKSRQQNQNNSNAERSDRPNSVGGRTGGRGRGRGRGRGGRGPVQNSFANNQYIQHQQPFYPQQNAPMQQQYYNQNAPQLQQMYPQQGYQQYHQGSQPFYQQQYQPQQVNYGVFPGYNYGAPPPPPPPPPGAPQQNSVQNSQHQNGNASASQSDTVYYDYSGS